MPVGLKGNVDGSGAIQVGGSDAITISTGLVVTGAVGNLMLQSGTAVTASGTSVDFTGIPSWVKRVTITFSALSGSGASDFLFQIGSSASPDITGYLGSASIFGASTLTTTAFTAGFGFSGGATAKSWGGLIVFTNVSGNTWAASGTFGRSDVNTTVITSGSKVLTGVLSMVRITHVNGTDTFDAGTINILWE